MVVFNDYEKYELKKLLEKLSEIRGRHTELVTVYIPDGYNINDIKTMIADEIGTASNIKSKSTRNNVITALEKVLGELKKYNVTPKNGLVIFCGNVSEREGQPDIKMWVINPPEPIKMRLYRCDQKFITEHVLDIFREKEVYGLITIDTNNAGIGILRGRRIEVIKDIDSLVPGKTGKGGQSSQRFARVREGMLLSFKKQVGELATNAFKEEKDLIGILIGGPGPVKDDFAQGDYLSEEMKRKILAVKDIGYAGEVGLKELVERSEDVLAESSILKEKKVLDKFFENLKRETGLVTYGLKEVWNALEIGAVDTLLISEDTDFVWYHRVCDCGYEDDKVVLKGNEGNVEVCPKCGKKLRLEEKDILKEFEEKAKLTSTEVYIISNQSPEGQQFRALGGFGAILRYKLEF